MSNVKWCDIGQHAFPANQNGATTLAVEQMTRNQWGGEQPANVVQDVCAACAVDAGIRKLTNMTEVDREAQAQQARDIRARSGGIFSRGVQKAITNGGTSTPGEKVSVDKEEYDRYKAYLEEQADLTDPLHELD